MNLSSVATGPMRIPPHRAQRHSVALPGRITWKDSRGATRFATVTTRNVSETGIFIEWSEPTSIPLYRLVSFQLEKEARNLEGIPAALRAGKVLSAVFRLGAFQKSTGTPEGYGLRLLVDPAVAAYSASQPVEATA